MRLDTVVSAAAHKQPMQLDFLDLQLREEIDAKPQRHGDQDRPLPLRQDSCRIRSRRPASVDGELVRELASGHFAAQAENDLLFGRFGVGKTRRAIALGRAVIGGRLHHPVRHRRSKKRFGLRGRDT